MRRVLLVHQPIDGGVARHVADLASGLAERELEVTLCGPAPPVVAWHPQANIRCVELDLCREIKPRTDLAAARRFTDIVRDTRPDVIHAHSSKAGVLARLQRLVNMHVPLVYTPHLYSFASSFASGAQRLAYREIERALAPLASRVICVCEQEAELARAIGPKDRVRLVYNGVAAAPPGEPADPRISELSRIGPVVCAIALLHRRKGLETLIAAAPSILASHPSAQFAIWGDGPELHRLQAHAARLGVEHAVHFLGLCADPIAALRDAHVFVHPALAEAFPYVILEAMSAGKPIVASDVGGIGEALIDGHSGVLVPPGESARLAEAVVELLANGAMAERIGAGALARFESHFSLTQMIDGVIGVYGEIHHA
jgi:glycosyltransferase involved in cell wall biosynthesis